MKLLIVALLLVSCSHYKVPKTIEEIPDIGPTPTEVVEQPSTPVEVPEVKTIKLPIVSLTGFTAEQRVRFEKIVKNVETLINTQEFKDMVLNFTYNKKQQFVDNEGFTNAQVLEKLLSKDWPIEYRLEKIPKKPFVALTVGYTYPNVTWVVINSLIFNTYDDADIACNIIHEMGGHKIARFGHAKTWSQSRDYSVPYGIGYGGEKLYRKMFPQ